LHEGRNIEMRNSALVLILATGILVLCAISTAAQTAQATPPPPTAPHSTIFPKPVEKNLPNGLRVIVIPRTEMPLVTAQLLIRSGAEVDPANLAGVTEMAAELLTRGTTTSATQIAEAIEALGGTLNGVAGWDAATVTTNVMSTQIRPAMEVMADVVRNPSFKDEEIDRARRQAMS